MNFRKTAKRIALGLLFVLILHFSARYWGMVLYPRPVNKEELLGGEWSVDLSTYYFPKIKRNSVDEVFIGSSHQYSSIDVNILNREYGMNSAMLSSSGQTLTLSYYAILEILELQDPKKIILEVNDCIAESEANTKGAHYFFDNIPNWMPLKYKILKEHGLDLMPYYYPVTVLHTGWEDIKWEYLLMPEKLPEGERFSYRYTHITPLEKWEFVSPEEKKPLPEQALRELTRIVELCEKNDIELILYIAPYVAGTEEQMIYNSLPDFAGEHGLRFNNLMYRMDEIGLDLNTDFLDKNHVNITGQEKITRYMAEKGML